MKKAQPKTKNYGQRSFAKQGKTKIKAVVFDWGGVVKVDGELQLEDQYKLRSKPKAEQLRYKKYLDKVERGHGSIKKLDEIMKEVLGYPGPIADIDKKILWAPLIMPSWNLMSRLRKKYIVAILTNNKKLYPEISAKNDGVSLKGIPVFNSVNIGVRKPKPGIYKYMLGKLKLRPEEVVFVDDKFKNIRGARELGIRAIWFTGSNKKLLAALKKFGVEAKI